jgi:signal transduction histidine kinase
VIDPALEEFPGPPTGAPVVPPSPQLAALQRQAVSTNLALSVAHEVNNMLSVIMASVELAGRAVAEVEDPAADLARVEEAAQRAAQVLADFLRFAGQRVSGEEALEPAQVIRDLSCLLDRIARRGIALRLLLEPTGQVRVARARLEATLLALVDNARDAVSGNGDISVVCRQRTLALPEAQACGLEPGSFASILVTDSGPGMSSDLVRRAAEPYFTTRACTASAGLGLSAAQAFAREAGGCLLLSSEIGHGTTAELVLPLIEPLSQRRQAITP